MKKILAALSVIGAIILLPSIINAQGQDWSIVIKKGEVIHASTIKIMADDCFNVDADTLVATPTGYGRETIINVLFEDKMWMCWQSYSYCDAYNSNFEEVAKTTHEFWCEESNK